MHGPPESLLFHFKQIRTLQFGQRSLANSPYANGKKRLLFIQKEKKDRAKNHKSGLRVTPEKI